MTQSMPYCAIGDAKRLAHALRFGVAGAKRRGIERAEINFPDRLAAAVESAIDLGAGEIQEARRILAAGEIEKTVGADHIGQRRADRIDAIKARARLARGVHDHVDRAVDVKGLRDVGDLDGQRRMTEMRGEAAQRIFARAHERDDLQTRRLAAQSERQQRLDHCGGQKAISARDENRATVETSPGEVRRAARARCPRARVDDAKAGRRRGSP